VLSIIRPATGMMPVAASKVRSTCSLPLALSLKRSPPRQLPATPYKFLARSRSNPPMGPLPSLLSVKAYTGVSSPPGVSLNRTPQPFHKAHSGGAGGEGIQVELVMNKIGKPGRRSRRTRRWFHKPPAERGGHNRLPVRTPTAPEGARGSAFPASLKSRPMRIDYYSAPANPRTEYLRR